MNKSTTQQEITRLTKKDENKQHQINIGSTKQKKRKAEAYAAIQLLGPTPHIEKEPSM